MLRIQEDFIPFEVVWIPHVYHLLLLKGFHPICCCATPLYLLSACYFYGHEIELYPKLANR